MLITGVVYFFHKDYGRTLYWISGAVLNIAVTFLIKQ